MKEMEISLGELKLMVDDYFFDDQLDRLNPEDHIVNVNKMVCDSQNCDNK